MARPDGMILTRITFGTAATIITGTPLAMRVTFTPTTDVIWAATGDVFVAFDETIPAASSGRGQVWLPNPDQNGFVDGAGNTIRNFAYKVTAVYTLGGAVVTRNTKYVTWTASDVGPIDLDLLIPVNTSPAVTVYIPDSWSAQVTAAQTAAQSAAASLAAILAGGAVSVTGNSDGTATVNEAVATDVLTPRTTAATVTTSGALTAGTHTPVDASSGNLTQTLPSSATVGAPLSVEKTDPSGNTVSISGSIRGAVTTLALTSQYESLTLIWSGATWRPTEGLRTITAINTAIDGKIATQATTDAATYETQTHATSTYLTQANAATGYVRAGTTGTLVDITSYGAVDGATDNYTAINNAITAATVAGVPVFFPPGVWRISQPIPFSTSFIGAGANATRLKPATTFTGSYLIEFNVAGTFKSIADMKLDMATTAIAVQGSSGDASGSSHTVWRNVHFVNGSGTVYAVGGSSSTVVAGMLTGSVFDHCRWESVPLWVNVGQNQDDVTFLGCRFMHTTGGTAPSSSPPLALTAQNITLTDTYMYVIGSGNTSTTDNPIITIGSEPVDVRGLFIECDATANYTHLFYQLNPSIMFRGDSIKYGMASNTNFIAIMRANLTATTGSGPNSARISNVGIKSGQTVTNVFEVLASTTGSTNSINLKLEGCDRVSNPVALAAASVASSSLINVFGTHKGIRYAHNIVERRGVTYFQPMQDVALGEYEITSSLVSGTSGNAGTFTIPGPGAYLAHIMYAANGNYGNAIVGTYLIYYYHSTLGGFIAKTQQLGSTQAGASTTAGMSTLTVSDPVTATAVVTVSATWTSGQSLTAALIINLKRLSGTGYLTT